jgi:hypothetical protein
MLITTAACKICLASVQLGDRSPITLCYIFPSKFGKQQIEIITIQTISVAVIAMNESYRKLKEQSQEKANKHIEAGGRITRQTKEDGQGQQREKRIATAKLKVFQ